GHWKPRGAFLLQTLRSKLRLIGRLMLMPRMLALSAVQRQTAASRSTKPAIRLQHGLTGGAPNVTFNKLSAFTQTPSFTVSFGHVWIAGAVGVGLGLYGPGGQPERAASVRAKKSMFKARKMAREFLLAIFISLEIRLSVVYV
ncbi:unnamed protein product, partial [Brassica oleracea var. botrytis]